jgi:hypothetical protein
VADLTYPTAVQIVVAGAATGCSTIVIATAFSSLVAIRE